MKKIIAYLDETVGELKRVVWPSSEKVASNTRIVLVSTLVFAAFFGLLDFGLFKVMDLIF